MSKDPLIDGVKQRLKDKPNDLGTILSAVVEGLGDVEKEIRRNNDQRLVGFAELMLSLYLDGFDRNKNVSKKFFIQLLGSDMFKEAIYILKPWAENQSVAMHEVWTKLVELDPHLMDLERADHSMKPCFEHYFTV